MKLATVEVFIPPTLTNTAHHRFPSLQWLTSTLWAATSSRFNSRPSQVEIIYFMKIGFYVVVLQLLSHVCLFATPWTVDHQVPLFMEFPRQEYLCGLPFPTPGYLPSPRIDSWVLQWQLNYLPLSHQGSPFSLRHSLIYLKLFSRRLMP